MTQFDYFSAQISEINTHATEATLGLLGFRNSTLRKALSELFYTETFAADKAGLLGNPVFDALFPWQSQPKPTQALTDLLHPKTIEAISDDIPSPYLHQHQAWQKLSTHHNHTPNSLIITSGTGSGKTECFMVPILDDLICQYYQHKQPLVGVQALFLYPLNALINSQQERLNKWTTPFGDGIRFCLYNGNTPENQNQANSNKNQIHDRTTLREAPPPILVTNATMLEYMLIRQKDAPILQQSQGTLKWIVLDETHTYVGSVASELSLLLRRVMLAFGVEAKNVRFVATSATIGNDNDAKKFLSQLTGVPNEQIHIVGASREIPELIARFDGSPAPLDEIVQTDFGQAISPKRFALLNNHPFAHRLRAAFTKNDDGTPTLRQRDLAELSTLFAPELTAHTTQTTHQYEHLLRWLDICSFTKANEQQPAFLPLRGHLFLKTLSGLYACANGNCTGKGVLDKSSNGVPDWQFGRLYANQKECCESCGSPVFELVFCDECQTPHLLTNKTEQVNNNRLIRKLTAFSKIAQDEFTLIAPDDDDADIDSETEQPEIAIHNEQPTLLMPAFASQNLQPESYQAHHLSPTGELSATPKDNTIPVFIKENLHPHLSPLQSCHFCESQSTGQQLRPVNLGSPFYMGEIAPKLLAHCQAFDNPENKPLPRQGKRLITFTDSRQGTARITMKLNHDAIQRTLWHIIYDTIAQGASHFSPEKAQELRDEICKNNTIIKALIELGHLELANEKQQKQLALQQQLTNTAPTAKPVAWGKMVEAIARHSQFLHIAHNLSKVRGVYHLDNDKALAHLLLLREFAYRPKRFNTLETLGLVYLHYPTLTEQKVPSRITNDWHAFGFDEKDWQDYLKLTLDFFVRNGKALTISHDEKEQLKAISSYHFGNFGLLAPSCNDKAPKNTKKWLQINTISPERSQRLIKLLALPKGLNLADPSIQDRIHQILGEVWNTLYRCDFFVRDNTDTSTTYRLALDKVELTLAPQVFVCPITHRLLDTTLQGYTPYLPPQEMSKILAKQTQYRCPPPIALPIYEPDPQDTHPQASTKAWLKANDTITKLRNDSLWTDISDTVVAGSSVLVASEHSAQIDQTALQAYEAKFKQGEINILNCSTTMEMGVDIGGISAVAMNNVPPHPANYLQRTGRAGRRGESQAIAFTLCKDNPHERMVFSHTKWAFDTKPVSPYVVLSSKKILQRHINAFLLAKFLANNDKAVSNVVQKVGQFFFDWHNDTAKSSYYAKQIETHIKPLLDTLPNPLSFEHTPFIKMQQWLEQLTLQGIDNELKDGISHLIKDSDFSAMPDWFFITECQKALSKLAQYTTHKLSDKLKEYKDLDNKNSTYKNKLLFDIASLANGFLLSELARFGFLPRYGFPSGLVELDIYNSKSYLEQKHQKNDKEAREDNLGFANGKPVRDLAIALREYAPGNEVAIDGLVFLSSGLSLSHRKADDNNDAQLIRYFAQCRHCGAMNPDAKAGEACDSCDKPYTQDDLTAFIEPMGFKVDYRAKPHARADSKSYVPVQDPKIQANTPFIPLPNPKLGSYRCDDNGLIFHHSRGIKGLGYFVCLHCGRAESVLHPKDSEDFQTQKEKFVKEHIPMKPLAERKKMTDDWTHLKGLCATHGNPVQYLQIGATDTTNVFEFYPKNPETGEYFDDSKDHESLLITLSVTLRDTLAGLYGINNDELGFGIKPVRLDNKNIQCVFIYDKAQGGAGFSSNAHHHLVQLFKQAPTHLECPDGCDTACHSCLLSYDTRFVANKLNRHLANAYLRTLVPLFDLPDDAKALLPNAQFCPLPIGERLAEQLIGTTFDTLTIFLHGEPQNWNLSTALQDKLWRLKDHPIHTRLVVNSTNLALLGNIDLQKLDGWLKTFDRLSLHRLTSTEPPPLLQLTSTAGETLTLASTDPTCGVPNDDFWQLADTALVVESSQPLVYATQPHQLPNTAGNSHTIKIGNELNGTLAGIGKRFWQLIAQQASSLSAQLTQKQGIKSITYSDPYVCTPLTVFLLVQTLNHLKQHYGDDWNAGVLIKTSPSKNEQNPTRLHHSWKKQEPQEQVINQYLKACGFSQEIKVYDKDKLPHYRYFQIVWENNQTTEIYLDWGFGFLEIDSSNPYQTKFDFGGTIEQQVKMLTYFEKSTLPLLNKKATMITVLFF